MPEQELIQCEFESETLRNQRTIWIQPSKREPEGVLVFLDGEYYLAHIRAAPIVSELQDEGTIPPMAVAYVSCIDNDIRWTESFCNEDFAKCVAEELLPWLESRFAPAAEGENILAGLSLTGLSAAHTALLYPNAFPRVLCQSGSFWWNNNWLTKNLPSETTRNQKFRITVGNEETREDVDHGKGLIQRDSQTASNEQMRDALSAKGHDVSYSAFQGDHNIASWRDDLPESLRALFA